MLNLEDDYNKDSPTSLGKSLEISRLKLLGKKNNEDLINYDQPFFRGLTTWIADNGQGKSSLFKIIKYCLTGHNSIKKDVKPWLHEISLEFKVGGNDYFIFIDKKERISQGVMYSLTIEEFEKLHNAGKIEAIEAREQFTFRGDDALANQLQTFFFNQFSFYSLKYTAKSSAKDDLSLKTANLSWATYFQTIYLQSSEHEYLFLSSDFGNQSSKIFEMILGLRLTYPINRLSLLMNLEDEKIAKLKLVDSQPSKKVVPQNETLQKELDEIQKEIDAFTNVSRAEFDTKGLSSEQLRIQAVINDKLMAHRLSQARFQDEINMRDKVKAEIGDFEHDQLEISSEINRLTKQIIGMETYRDVEGFFTNLEIKSCPHCENIDLEGRFAKEKIDHACGLCGSTNLSHKVDVEEINEKITDIKLEIETLSHRIITNQTKLEALKQSLLHSSSIISEISTQYSFGPGIDQEERELDEISRKLKKIQVEREMGKESEEKLDLLKQNRAILKYRLEEANKPTNPEPSNEDEINQRILKKQVLVFAINELKSIRQLLNQELLSKLEGLILGEVQAFGLNVTKVAITNNYNLSFLQNGELELFEELNESEKLRAKFAFYLSLIQLDIEYKLGRHPRFLIIDSPGSEEISKSNLNGLSAIFEQVGQRFGNELQIFIGTTLHEFSTITSPKQTFSKKNKEFIF